MELTIISPEGVLLNETADFVSLPGSMGAFSILKGHAPMVSTLEKGSVVYIQNKKEKNYDIEGGVTVVEKDVVRVIVESLTIITMSSKRVKLGVKILLLLSATYITVGIITEVVYYFLAPAGYFELYPAIGAFYLVMGFISFHSLVRYRNTSQTHLLNVYMFGRIVKLFLTIFFLLIYIFLFDPHKKPFALTMFANYIVFSGLELYIYSLFIRRLTKHEKKHKTHN